MLIQHRERGAQQRERVRLMDAYGRVPEWFDMLMADDDDRNA
jgi:hypothetical protein